MRETELAGRLDRAFGPESEEGREDLMADFGALFIAEVLRELVELRDQDLRGFGRSDEAERRDDLKIERTGLAHAEIWRQAADGAVLERLFARRDPTEQIDEVSHGVPRRGRREGRQAVDDELVGVRPIRPEQRCCEL